MAFTFDPALPSARDRARLRLGDTDASDVLLDDASIDGMLAGYSFNEALAQMAESIAAALARKAEEVQGMEVRYSYRARSKTYLELAKVFRGGDQPDGTPETFFGAAGEMSHPDLTNLRMD